jgi:hypothetical protein
MPNPPTERDWMLVIEMVRAALERVAADKKEDQQ